MSRFARIEQEAFLRRTELVDENRKQGYNQTFLLYAFILLHSWGSGKCEKTLPELCEIYNLEYHNSTRRLRILREKGWIEDTDKYIRPLLVQETRTVKITVPESEQDETVNPTDNDCKNYSESSVKITPDECKNYTNDGEASVEITPQSVKITPNQCKNYTEIDEISVKITPENGANAENSSGYESRTPFLNFKPSIKDSTAAEKTAAAAVENNDCKSQFSIEECLRYAEICVKRGEPIKNKHGLAVKAYKTGNDDVFIRAALYPEQTEDAPEKPAEFSDERYEALEILSDLKQSGEDIKDMRQWYTPEVWAWLMEKLENVR